MGVEVAMSHGLKSTLSHLWRAAPLWRATVIGAAVLTLAALLNHGGGGGGPASGSSGGAGSYQPPTAVAPPAMPPSGATVPPVDQAAFAASEQRWSRFVAEVQGSAKLAEAPRCEAMLVALRDLTDFDQQTKGRHKDRAAAEQEAQRCRPLLAASDQRLERLVVGWRGWSADRSAPAAKRLAESAAALTDYDRQRALTEEQRESIEAGRTVAAALAESEQRIAAMQGAAAAYQPEAPITFAPLLAAVAAVNNAFDQSRLTAAQRQAFADGSRLEAQFRASDGRVARLTDALAAVRVTEDTAAREGLVAAVGTLEPFDRQRADGAQRSLIEDAQARANGYALALLVDAAAGFQSDRATAADYTRLAGLRLGLPELDKTGLTPAQERAVAIGDSAVTALRASDRRIAEGARVLADWNAAPNKQAVTQRVIDAYAAVTPLDRERLDHAQAETFARLESAWRIVTKKDGGAWAGARDQVPVFVEVSGSAADAAAQNFREQLRANGFRVAGSRDEAALLLDLAGDLTHLGRAPFGENLHSARVKLALNARWAYDGSSFTQARGDGNGVSSSEQNAQRDAFAKAAQVLFNRFLEQVEKSVPPASAAPSKALSHSTR